MYRLPTWIVRALPPGIPVAVEVPTLELARTVNAVERARRAIAGVRRVLAAAEREQFVPQQLAKK